MSNGHQPLRTFSGCTLLSLLLLSLFCSFAKAQSAPGTLPDATPVISPLEGQYGSAQTITITDSTPGATIYYNIDTGDQFTAYNGPFTLANEGYHRVLAYALAAGFSKSQYAQSNIDIALPAPNTPTISLASGRYTGPQVITLSDSTPNATIYYTLDGSSPYYNPDRLVYTGPITITGNTALSTEAEGASFGQSWANSAQFTIAGADAPFMYTIAGSGHAGYDGDGGPATNAKLNDVMSVAKDAAGNVFIADAGNYVIRKVAAGTGVITTYAGSGINDYTGDGGPATQASIGYCLSIVVDSLGNLYIADRDHSVVRKVSASTGVISTFAGTGISEGRTTNEGGLLRSITLARSPSMRTTTSTSVTLPIESARSTEQMAPFRLWPVITAAVTAVTVAPPRRPPSFSLTGWP